MRAAGTRAALRHYDERRDPVDHKLDPILPAVPGEVHAVDLRPDRRVRGRSLTILDSMREPLFSSYSQEYEAMCGPHVRVILPVAVDLDDPDMCPRCRTWLTLRDSDPAEYARQMRTRRDDRVRRDQEADDVADWNRRNQVS